MLPVTWYPPGGTIIGSSSCTIHRTDPKARVGTLAITLSFNLVIPHTSVSLYPLACLHYFLFSKPLDITFYGIFQRFFFFFNENAYGFYMTDCSSEFRSKTAKAQQNIKDAMKSSVAQLPGAPCSVANLQLS